MEERAVRVRRRSRCALNVDAIAPLGAMLLLKSQLGSLSLLSRQPASLSFLSPSRVWSASHVSPSHSGSIACISITFLS